MAGWHRRHSLRIALAFPALAGCGINVRRNSSDGDWRTVTEREAPRIDVAAAFEAVRAGRAVLVDVRGEASYRQKRAAGAVLLTVEDIERAPADAARRLPADKQPILYCT